MNDTERLLKTERAEPPPPSEPAGPPPPAPAGEEAGTRALSEALRSSFIVVKVVMVLLVLAFLGSGITTVGPQQRAIKLRFGRPVGEGEEALLGPGLRWAYPAPIDEVVTIPLGQVQSVRSTIGWYYTTAAEEAAGAEPLPGESLDPAKDGYVLTADANIIHVRGALRYRIREPGIAYMFNFANASNLVQEAFNNAIVHAAATMTVDDILTRDVAGFRERVTQYVEENVRRHGLGIVVDQVDLQAIPPRQLKQAFAAVLEAEVRRSQILNEARSYENQTLSKAKSRAAAITNAAIAERALLVESTAAEAKRFADLLPEYRKNPELFMQLRRTETLARVFTNSQEKIVLQQRADGRPRELRLLLSREPVKVKPLETPRGHEHSD